MRPLLLLLLLSPLAACGDASVQTASESASAEGSDAGAEARPRAPAVARPSAFFLNGVYLGPLYDGAAMLVDHEAIPDRMPAMQMQMRVKLPGLLDGLAQGTPIRMTVDSASLSVISIDKLPEGTVLELAGEETGGGGIVLPE